MTHTVAIASAGAHRLDRIFEFIRSWSEDDAYERFGVLGGREWLLRELRANGSRGTIVASHGKRVVGLLDHVESEGAVHIGVVVDAHFRGLHIGSELVFELLRTKLPRFPVTAECRAYNHAAIGLLNGCGFERVTVECDEIVWRHQ